MRYSLLPLVGLLLVTSNAFAEIRALPPGQLPNDSRLGPLRTLDDYFPFKPVESRDAWNKRADSLRRRVLLANGLWPLPTRTPMEPVIHGKVDRGDFTVERVYFQSWPGFYLTGSLFRPKGDGTKHPAVICPHGHANNGRFNDIGEDGVRQQIAMGAERFESSGRSVFQAKGAQLARMGCVVFLYDMIGYADSVQLPDHRPGVRESMNTAHDWGLFSPQAELQLQSIMGIQTWNSMRAVDFISSLPDVDVSRIAVTGHSGGGTQTMMLIAADDRPALSFPVVMVSTSMQGGCTCENADYLRIGAGNIDIAALALPRPLGVVSADDWTKEIMTKGLPDLQGLYAMFGIPDRLFGKAFLQFPHNYNAVSRMQLYSFVNKHFHLGQKQPIIERDFPLLSKEELTVWDAGHPAPSGDKVGDAFERALLRWMTDDSKEQMSALVPTSKESLEKFRHVVGGAFDTMIDRRSDSPMGPITAKVVSKNDRGPYVETVSLLRVEQNNEEIPVLTLAPDGGANGEFVIWLDPAGKASLCDEAGAPRPHAQKLLTAGYSIVGIDLFMQGEFLPDPSKPLESARVKGYGNPKEAWQRAACYTFGYNPPLFASRVQDALSLIRYLQSDPQVVTKIHLVGLGPEAGPVAAAVRAQAGSVIDKTAIDTEGFRFASLTRVDHPMFLPGAVKYGDVPALLALCAPAKLWLNDEKAATSPVVGGAYRSAGAEAALTIGSGGADAALAWILQK